jgi:hypothetical protein
MRKKNYGSTKSTSDLIKSYEHSQKDEIISQTYFKCSYIIEPVVFLQTIAASIISIAFGQFIYTRILTRLIENENIPTNVTLFFDKPDSFCNSNSTATNSSDLIRLKAQKETANFFYLCSLYGGIPCIFTTNLLGVNCSKLGRKCLLLIGLTIMTLRCIVFLLISIYPALPDYLFYICAFFDGLSGSNGLFYLVLHCYIADLTTTKTRSYRLTFINYIGSISSLLISYTCGYVIKYLGYVYIFAASLIFYFLSLVYLVIFVPEPLSEVRTKSFLQRLHSCSIKRIKNSVYVLLRKNHPVIIDKKLDNNEQETSPLVANVEDCGQVRQRYVIVLVVIANLIYCGGAAGIVSIFTLYIMNEPFCWDSVNISMFTVYSTVISFVLSLFVSRFIRVSDILICIISAASHLSSLILYVFATSSFFVYLGSTTAALSGLEFGYVRSLVSKLVTKHEVTDALTFIACVDTFTGVLASIIFPLLYARFVDYKIQILFYIGAGIVSITIILHV